MKILRIIGCAILMLWCATLPGSSRADSTISLRVPVEVPVAAIQQALEAAVPQRIERLGATEFDNGLGFRYGAWRGPFTVIGAGNALRIGVRIEFAVWVCKQVNKPWPLRGSFCQAFASCGYGEPLPAIELWTTVGASWSPDWSVAPSVSTNPTTIRPCKLTMFNIDGTGRAIGLLRSKVDEAAAKIRERLQLRSRAEELWNRVKPISLGGDRWIVWRADAIRVGPIAFPSWAITSDAAIDLSARVVTSATPPAQAPLPPSLIIGAGTVPMPVYLQLQLAASWADLETVLKSKLRAYTTGKVQITLQKLSGSSGRVQLELGASGEISTTITASAALAYAPSSGELSLSDIKIAAPAENIGSAIDVPVLEGALAARLTLQLDALMGQHLTNLGGGLLSLAGARADSVSATAASLEAHYTVPAPPLLIQP